MTILWYRETELKLFRLFGLTVVLLFPSVLFPGITGADSSSVRLEVPAETKPGSDITVRVFVTHEGNNFFHYTDWLFVAVGEKEIRRWEFAADRRPEDENFTREITYTVYGPTTFRAQANCNIHGSAGPAEATVRVSSPVSPAASNVAPPSPVVFEKGRSVQRPPATRGRRGLGLVVLALGIVNLFLAGFQVASGRRWIPVKIPVHRRTGQLLVVLALIHGLLAILLSS